MTGESTKNQNAPRVLAGLLVVSFGVALLLDNLGVFEVGNILRFWPLGLIAVGAAKVLQDSDASNRTGGWILIGLGVLFAVETLAFSRFNVWRWWPLAIVIFGGMLMMRAMKPSAPAPKGAATQQVMTAPALFSGTTGNTTESTVSDFVLWSGLQRRVTASNFKSADLTAIMGGIELDLRQASTENGEAVVDVFVMWGGIEITVPPDWAVTNEVTPIMGGAEDKSTGTQQARHRLKVTGVVIMGGIDIKT